jgi:hypothetical protein
MTLPAAGAFATMSVPCTLGQCGWFLRFSIRHQAPRHNSKNGHGWSTNDITRQTFEESLVNTGRFDVIAGSQRENLLKEQGYSNSDLVDAASGVVVARLLTARWIV